MAEKKKIPAAEKSDKRAEIILVHHYGDKDFVQLYKDIAPSAYRNDDIGSNNNLKEYDLALRRNYKRMCRSEGVHKVE